jgi:hypothetical protein
MSALRTIFSGIAEGMAPDGTLVRVRLRLSLEHLVTLVVTVMAVGLAVAYQVLRHLPESWARWLLGDSDTQE